VASVHDRRVADRLARGIHYGWYVLAASVVIELFGLGFGIFAITTVYPYIIDAFPDWSRTTVFAPTTIIIAIVGLMSPITGTIIDRYPIRILFAAGITLQSIGLLLFSQVHTPFGYFATSALVGLGMSTVTILPNQVLVSRWFHQRVGLVNGIILGATALGAAIAPALITRIIEISDWRTAFAWMSLLAFAPPLLVTLFVVRDRPQDRGLQPYGVAAAEARAAEESTHFTLAEALRTSTFWVLVAAIFVGGMPCYSYNKHILVHLKELGYPPVQAADFKSFFFLIAACSRVSFGWLCDRFDKRRMMLLHFVFIAAAYPLVLLVPEHRSLLMPCLLILGVGYGGLLPSMPIMAVHYFGRTNLGKILGVCKVGYDIAAATAPLFTAYLYDVYHTYRVPDLWNTAFAWTGVALVAFGLRPKRSRPAVPG
jgi:sugar phosphate permease